MARTARVTLVRGPLSYTLRGVTFRRGMSVPVSNPLVLKAVTVDNRFDVKYEGPVQEKAPPPAAPKKTSRKPEPPPEDGDDDEEEGDDEEDEPEVKAPTRASLKELGKTQLKELAEKHGIDTEGKSKAELVDAILGVFAE